MLAWSSGSVDGCENRVSDEALSHRHEDDKM